MNEPHTAIGDMSDFLTVNFPMPLAPYRPKYAIMRDKTAAEIVAFAKKNYRKRLSIFIFPVATKSPEECHDYNFLLPSFRRKASWRSRVVLPFYFGNLEPMESAIRQYVEISLGTPLVDCDEISA